MPNGLEEKTFSRSAPVDRVPPIDTLTAMAYGLMNNSGSAT